MDDNAQTQRVYDDAIPTRCIEHMRRLDRVEDRVDRLEDRMTDVEKLHNAISALQSTVAVLSDRVKLVLWMTGVATAGIILGVIGLFFKALGGQ